MNSPSGPLCLWQCLKFFPTFSIWTWAKTLMYIQWKWHFLIQTVKFLFPPTHFAIGLRLCKFEQSTEIGCSSIIQRGPKCTGSPWLTWTTTSSGSWPTSLCGSKATVQYARSFWKFYWEILKDPSLKLKIDRVCKDLFDHYGPIFMFNVPGLASRVNFMDICH